MGCMKDLMTLAHGEAYADELFHFGIKGMKWGVRRYQNADGSYTAAGKKRYSSLKKTANDAVRNYRQYKLNKSANYERMQDNVIDNWERSQKRRYARSPEKYERWHSGKRMAIERGIAKYLHNRTTRLMNKYGKKYETVYAIPSGKYILREKSQAKKVQPQLKKNPTNRDIENYVNDLIGAGRVTDEERAKIKRKFPKKSK